MIRLATLLFSLMFLASAAGSVTAATSTDALEERASEAYDGGDTVTAFSLWLQAAELGDLESIVIVAGFYETGEADIVDLGKARHWYAIGAKRGDPLAMIRLADLLLQESTQNTDVAAKWLQKSARLGHPLAKQILDEFGLSAN
ncbi:tetratricopeptide repeat protein [Coralliovum pocilloporae]|uniref:tetratricopeptide repeat protein n=1 Tax=Coralliovum pocilloporae TaxID=3066369 RepID=UPI003307713C